jgi:hypothetical protein
MAEGHLVYHDNGAKPFKSAVYSVGDGAPGLLAFSLLVHRHDMVIAIVGNGGDRTQVLYLQNIREDTLSEAETAIGKFLDNFGPLRDGDSVQNTVFQDYGPVYHRLNRLANHVDYGVEKVEQDLTQVENDSFNYPKRAKDTTAGKYNPVCEMIAACSEFRDRVYSIIQKASGNACPKRDGELWIADSYPPHQSLLKYLEEQSESRDLKFCWEMRVSSSKQRLFQVRP